jgi:hypothetical protein
MRRNREEYNRGGKGNEKEEKEEKKIDYLLSELQLLRSPKAREIRRRETRKEISGEKLE